MYYSFQNNVHIAKQMQYRLQYSIYAGRHVVPGLEGLLLECTADVECAWSPLSMLTWPSTAQVITRYLVSMIEVHLCSNNGT